MARLRKKSKSKQPRKRPDHSAAQEREAQIASGAFSHIEAADAACLVGEIHLKNGEYEKAVQAFTQAIDTNPTPDAYQGRAEAYRALADGDERTAQEQRGN
jgi:uncharacterized protein HemY